jgi:TolB-like protein/class 3 adenylate cyclase
MSTESLKRKLAAMLSADVKGYSRLMRENEETTIRTLTAYREVMASLIQQYRGRVVDSPGDNLLAEFASVVDAVNCAAEIQRQLGEKNEALPSERRMAFRIGINLGDVFEEGERIYGDGVNITARIESLADGGGICISGTVYDAIEGKLDYEYDYLGPQRVKNIDQPVRAYRVRTNPVSAFYRASGEHKLHDKPSIAVMPFVNMSRDPEQEYFGDGITEDLITDLSKISGLFVIARNSVFTYKGRPVKVQQVSDELGVRYVLEGSVRKVGSRVRITAQLVDAFTGGHIWAERYDRDLEDIFALQDEVTQKIVAVLAVRLREGEQERLAQKNTDNLLAYDYFLRALEHFNRYSKEANAEARRLFIKATELDPTYALAYAKAGWTYLTDWTMGWSQSRECLDLAYELAQKAVGLDASMEESHCLLGHVHLWKKNHEKAIALFEEFIALNPNHADTLSDLGDILNFSGQPEKAIGLIRKAMRLNPLYPTFNLFNLGHAYFLSKRYEEALEALKGALSSNPDFFPARAYLAATYIELGIENEARAEAREIHRKTPESNLEIWRQRLPYKNEAHLARVLDALEKTGLK